jgi:hypothetical protein
MRGIIEGILGLAILAIIGIVIIGGISLLINDNSEKLNGVKFYKPESNTLNTYTMKNKGNNLTIIAEEAEREPGDPDTIKKSLTIHPIGSYEEAKEYTEQIRQERIDKDKQFDESAIKVGIKPARERFNVMDRTPMKVAGLDFIRMETGVTNDPIYYFTKEDKHFYIISNNSVRIWNTTKMMWEFREIDLRDAWKEELPTILQGD